MGHDDAVSQMCWFDEQLYTASWDSTVKVLQCDNSRCNDVLQARLKKTMSVVEYELSNELQYIF